ncbi:MAG: hypothetical protein ACHQUB_01790 [Candidatus Saccharimonadia bacterium]
MNDRLKRSFVWIFWTTLSTLVLATSLLGGQIRLNNAAIASQTVPYKINFQGRLTDNNGNILPDGSYNIKFRLWNALTGGSNVWEGDRVYGTSDYRVAVANGLFNIQFGDTTQGDPALSPSLFSGTFPLYLEVELPTPATATCNTNACASFTEGAMTPRQSLASSPYAINADTLDGIDSVSFGQLSSSQTWTGTNAIDTTSANAFQVKNAGGTESILNVDTSGNQVLLGTTGSSGLDGQLLFNTATSGNYAVTLNSSGSLTGNYTLTLPIAGPSTSQCLQSGASTASQLIFVSCSETLQQAYNNGSTINTTAGGTISISAAAPPTADIVSISNAGQAVTTNNANGLEINFVGGSAAVNASGIDVDYTPGTTSGGTWNGVSIVANTSGAATGVTSYGIVLTGPTSLNGGTNTAVEVGTGWNIGVDIQSGAIQIATQSSDPASPAANNLRIYAKTVAGRILPEWLGPSDQNTAFQPGLGFNRISFSEPNGTANCSTGATGFGSTSTGAGTCTAPAPASTNIFTSVRLLEFSSGTTAGTVAYQRQGVLQVWRGNAAGLGGFFYVTRFGLNTLQSGNRAFVGLADSVANPTNVDPTTNATPGKIGMAINANTGNWNFVNNITGTAPTVTGLGANFPVNTTDLFEMVMYCPVNGSTISYRITDESTGNQTTGSVSANIPGTTTFLAPLTWITNNATAAAAILGFNFWYLESDN